MKKQNQSKEMVNYQKVRREETLKKIDAAINYLYNNGLELTKQNIVNTAGISYSVMYHSHVIDYLSNHPVYNHAKTIKELRYEDRIKKLEKEVERLKRTNKSLTAKNKKLTDEVEVKNNVIIETVEKTKKLYGEIHKLQEENFLYKKRNKGFVVVDSGYECPDQNEVHDE